MLQRITMHGTGPRWAWLQLGLHYLDQSDAGQAITALQHVIRADPNDKYNITRYYFVVLQNVMIFLIMSLHFVQSQLGISGGCILSTRRSYIGTKIVSTRATAEPGILVSYDTARKYQIGK